MAKASRPGLSKTRLCPPLTPEEAARFNTAFLQDVAANIRAAGSAADVRGYFKGSISGYMAFGPPGSEPFFRDILPQGIGLLECWLPNFGDCLFNAITQQLDQGHQAAVVLNSDSPTLPTSLLVETAEVLARPGDRVVLGPSTDGGYYLLGLKAPHRRMFENIDWSTERVARQTLERAREIGLSVHTLPAWYDVDDADALRTVHAELCADISFAADLVPHRAEKTAALLHALIDGTDLIERLHTARAGVVERAAE
jgi:rSAM/selenodomain-associated transferase 1